RSTMGPWASQSPGADYQSGNINTNNDYSDGNSIYRTSDSQYTLSFPAPSGPDRVVFAENWHHNNDGSWLYSWDVDRDMNCYSASCSVSIDANVPGTSNGVKSDQGYTVHTNITNTGQAPLPYSVAGQPLDLTGGGGSYYNAGNPVVYANNSSDIQPGE